MESFCPGSKQLRKPVPKIYPCPQCGDEIEIWSDEIRGQCLSCGHILFKEGNMSCLEWCQSAEECVGAEAYGNFCRNKVLGLKDKIMGFVAESTQYSREQLEAYSTAIEKQLQETPGDWHIAIPAGLLTHLFFDPAALTGAEFEESVLDRIGEFLQDQGVQEDIITTIVNCLVNISGNRDIGDTNSTIILNTWKNLEKNKGGMPAINEKARRILAGFNSGRA